jgi:hypothetical protein
MMPDVCEINWFWPGLFFHIDIDMLDVLILIKHNSRLKNKKKQKKVYQHIIWKSPFEELKKDKK